MNCRVWLDRVLIVAVVIVAALYANGGAMPSVPQAMRKLPHADLRCAEQRQPVFREAREDFFVPAVPYEPMESLEN